MSKVACRSAGTKGCAFALAETLGAVTVVQQVVADAYRPAVPGGSEKRQLPLQDVLQVLWEQSISLAGRQAVNAALLAVPGAVQKLMTLLQVSALECKQFHAVTWFHSFLHRCLTSKAAFQLGLSTPSPLQHSNLAH